MFRTRKSKVECGTCAYLIASGRGGEIVPRLGDYGPKQKQDLAPLMKAEDIKQPVTYTVKACVAANIKGETKPRVTFVETDKEWIVNATNAQELANLFGDVELEQLVGKRIQLASVPTQYEGKPVKGIRVIGKGE